MLIQIIIGAVGAAGVLYSLYHGEKEEDSTRNQLIIKNLAAKLKLTEDSLKLKLLEDKLSRKPDPPPKAKPDPEPKPKPDPEPKPKPDPEPKPKPDPTEDLTIEQLKEQLRLLEEKGKKDE